MRTYRKRTAGGCAPSPSGSGKPSQDVFAGWLKMLWGFEVGRPRVFREKWQSPTAYSLALRISETAIVTLVVVGFGRVIRRSNQELGDSSTVEKFSGWDQRGQGGSPPKFRNFANSSQITYIRSGSTVNVGKYIDYPQNPAPTAN